MCVALVSAYCVQASTMHEESATKTVTYLQLETVMQSVAMLTADYRVMITENVVRHQVDAQYYPLGVWWLLQCPTLDSEICLVSFAHVLQKYMKYFLQSRRKRQAQRIAHETEITNLYYLLYVSSDKVYLIYL